MVNHSFTLESLLEIHHLPFIIINSALKIVAVNKAWEKHFDRSKAEIIGQDCCNTSQPCRHQQLFEKFEPYSGLFPDANAESPLLSVRGYPLLDNDGQVYLGETITNIPQLKGRRPPPDIIGTSPIFADFRNKLEQASRSQAPVMINGETGTGKELAAYFIHSQSQNANANFVVVDCTVLGDGLFESELFGHEKGSFTGASSAKKGLFELADQGTLFLDEIAELPLHLQPKLLRALETSQFRRVGGTTTLTSKVRVISATHKSLVDMVRAEQFREDLYYRLSVFPLNIPTLQERKQDIPLLVQYLLKQLGDNSAQEYQITKNALIKLMKHNWPGNIRELRNCIHLATSLCSNQTIEESDIHIQTLSKFSETLPFTYELTPLLPEPSKTKLTNPLDQIEAEFIRGLITKYQGNRKLIALEMNISERTLYRKLHRLNFI